MIRSLTGALARKRSALGQKEKGFTLIELLVVVIIIGILAAIAIPIFLGQQDQAKGSAVQSAITNAKTSIIANMVTTGVFPSSTTTPTMASILTKAKGDSKITLTPSGSSTAFCIQGSHSEVSGKTWAADDNGGVIVGTCDATTFKAVP
jgi:type IV pilus assembly protein PilA